MASNLSCVGLGVADGEELERLVVDEIRPRAALLGRGRRADVRDLTAYADRDAFRASPDSLLGPADEPPPPHFEELGFEWPQRKQLGWLISPTVFGHGEPSASAAITAEVIDAERRVNTLTGQTFVVARVQVAEVATAHVCLDGGEFLAPPASGAVLMGEVFLVASLAAVSDGVSRPRRRFGLGRRRR
ncbi:MAG: hypothetical protein AB7O78_16725 [Thermoleophilia bacterium]